MAPAADEAPPPPPLPLASFTAASPERFIPAELDFAHEAIRFASIQFTRLPPAAVQQALQACIGFLDLGLGTRAQVFVAYEAAGALASAVAPETPDALSVSIALRRLGGLDAAARRLAREAQHHADGDDHEAQHVGVQSRHAGPVGPCMPPISSATSTCRRSPRKRWR
jgi:hypothetical protein